MKIIDRYEKNGQKFDAIFYTVLLRHLSLYYYTFFENFNDEIIQSLFILAKELFNKYKPDYKVKLPYMLRQVENAFENSDIELWKLASCFQ